MLRSIMSPPWGLRIDDRAPLTLIALVRGEAWVVPHRGEPVRLAPGDVAIVRGPDPYTVAADPTAAPDIVIHPGQQCTTTTGQAIPQAFDLGVRTWGNDPHGATMMLTGTYQSPTEVSRRLVDALPALVVLEAAAWDHPLLALLADEASKDRPGQEAVLDRLLDLVLIAAVRTWLDGPATAPPWLAADADPVVGRALRMLHHSPAHPWTVASLGAAVGVSRATLARRFGELVGESPMTYLTRWRLDRALDLLREPGASLSAVARQVGYGSPFALSAAYKRVHGISPTQAIGAR